MEYYGMMVETGREGETEMYLRRVVPHELYGEIFFPKRKRNRKLRGEWKLVTERLIPGYIFISTDKVKDLFINLRRYAKLTKLLGVGQEYATRLTEEDVEWLQNAMSYTEGDDDHVVEISRVYVKEGEGIKILDGPLKYMEGQIKKIDLHRRTAEVEVNFMGQTMDMYVGIDLLESIEKS